MVATRLLSVSAIVLGILFVTPILAQDRSIDTTHSSLRVRVFKSGLFSAFAHDHEIQASIAAGTVRVGENPSVTLEVHARELHVLDPDASADTRADVQKTMEGSDVLGVNRFPEISFQSTEIQKKGDQHWTVRGNLTLHGRTSAVDVDVVLRDGHFEGFAQLKQRDFGMTPVSIAGGTVKVKDEVRIEFTIVLKQ
jgi:polyisoprenoid-binding protein YceI